MGKGSFKIDDDSGLLGGDGCTYYPHCLQCPREVCRFDEERPRITPMDAKILKASQPSLGLAEIAQRLGISRRQVVRLLANT